eukprot:Hpha_TRINITY_DN15056_c0_g20::TRINITY_DN15056_c0_g20_i1::g.126160::m.126160
MHSPARLHTPRAQRVPPASPSIVRSSLKRAASIQSPPPKHARATAPPVVNRDRSITPCCTPVRTCPKSPLLSKSPVNTIALTPSTGRERPVSRGLFPPEGRGEASFDAQSVASSESSHWLQLSQHNQPSMSTPDKTPPRTGRCRVGRKLRALPSLGKSYVMLGEGPVSLGANHDGECFTVEAQEEVHILGEDGTEDSPLQHFLRVRTVSGTEGWLRAVDVDQAAPLRTPTTTLTPTTTTPKPNRPPSMKAPELVSPERIAEALESKPGMWYQPLMLAKELGVSKRALESAISQRPVVYNVRKDLNNATTEPLNIQASDGHVVAVRLGADGSSLYVGDWVCAGLTYHRERLQVHLELGEDRDIVLPHMPSRQAILLKGVLRLAEAAGAWAEGFPDAIRARIELEPRKVTLVTL